MSDVSQVLCTYWQWKHIPTSSSTGTNNSSFSPVHVVDLHADGDMLRHNCPGHQFGYRTSPELKEPRMSTDYGIAGLNAHHAYFPKSRGWILVYPSHHRILDAFPSNRYAVPSMGPEVYAETLAVVSRQNFLVPVCLPQACSSSHLDPSLIKFYPSVPHQPRTSSIPPQN
jgi:hypothetical protein